MVYETLIGPTALAGLIEAGEVALFDCSFDLADSAAGHRAFRAGHLPGAHYLHLDRDLAGRPDGRNGRHPLPDPHAFAASLRACGLHLGRQVIAYDSSGGVYAARLWWMLRWIGHRAVAILDGGTQAWTAAGRPLEHGDAPPAAPGDFVAHPVDPAATVTAADVLADLGSPSRLIIDARAPQRFRGEPNPLDPVAGHIPGARNRYFADNLMEGRFKPADLLAEAFAPLLPASPDREIILQCGSGVTACHNALALEIAGIRGAKLYPGSWSEWIADPDRPVARGDDPG